MKCSPRRAVSTLDGLREPPEGSQIDVGTVGVGRHLEASQTTTLLIRGRQDDGTRAIAEEDAGAPIGEVDEPRQELGADDEHVTSHAAAHERVGGRVAVDEAGAGRRDVEGSRCRVADGLLQEHGRGGHRVVGGQGRHDDDVDVVG